MLWLRCRLDLDTVIPKSCVSANGMSQDEQAEGHTVGIDLESGEPFDPTVDGIWDNYRVKRQMLHSWSVLFRCICVSPPPDMETPVLLLP